jgi:hypothetical protein
VSQREENKTDSGSKRRESPTSVQYHRTIDGGRLGRGSTNSRAGVPKIRQVDELDMRQVPATKRMPSGQLGGGTAQKRSIGARLLNAARPILKKSQLEPMEELARFRFNGGTPLRKQVRFADDSGAHETHVEQLAMPLYRGPDIALSAVPMHNQTDSALGYLDTIQDLITQARRKIVEVPTYGLTSTLEVTQFARDHQRAIVTSAAGNSRHPCSGMASTPEGSALIAYSEVAAPDRGKPS